MRIRRAWSCSRAALGHRLAAAGMAHGDLVSGRRAIAEADIASLQGHQPPSPQKFRQPQFREPSPVGFSTRSPAEKRLAEVEMQHVVTPGGTDAQSAAAVPGRPRTGQPSRPRQTSAGYWSQVG